MPIARSRSAATALVLAAALLAPLAGCRVAGARAAPRPSPEELERRLPAVERIAAEALARGGAWAKLASLCATAPHRLSGSRGAADAVEWARAAMIADGLENVRLEPCTVPRWERGEPEELVATAPAELAGRRLPVLALGGSVATPSEGIEAAVVAVTSFDELRELGERARGKVVLFARPMDAALADPFEAYGGAVDQRARGAVEAARAGAVAALVRSMTTLRDDVPHTGAMRYEDGVARIPAAAVSTNAADEIVALLGAGREVRVRLTLSCAWREPVESFNVVGELVGSERPDEIVLVGGHLDGWDVGEGAHDDGAGCCQSIEALRLLKALDLRPRRTVRCVLFMNEENGGAGARAYREAHAEELERHVLAFESDSGGFTPRGFSFQAEGAELERLRDMAALLDSIGAGTVTAGGAGADVAPLGEAGVTVGQYLPDGQRYFDFHHSERDVLAAVNRRELELGAAAIAAMAWLAADLF